MTRRRLGVAVLAILFWAFVLLGVRRTTDAVDRPFDSLEMPPPDSDAWLQGQGPALRMSLLSEGTHPTPAGTITILPDVLEKLPYKNNEETPEWVAHVNATYRPAPAWVHRPERRLGHYKCMSVSASTVRDWLRLREGASMPEYVSMLNGASERGLNPKVLDSLYYEGGFELTGPDHLDPVAGVPVPCAMSGFVKLLTDPPAEHPVPDVSLPGVTYPWKRGDLLPDYEVVDVPLRAERMRDALREHGVLFAGIRVRFSASGGVVNRTRLADAPVPFATGHAVVIVGWIEQGYDLYFVYRETFGRFDETTPLGGPAYRVYPAFGFSEVYAFKKR